MKNKKLTIITVIILFTINISGCVNENPSIDETNNFEEPENVYVDDNYDKNTSGWDIDHFDSIQEGINKVSENGTIYINSGIYYENLVINKSINIIGEEKETTIINGNQVGNVVNIIKDYCTIQNINISNAGSNSGINILSNSNTLTNNIFYDNYYGICIDSKKENTISNNIFSDNYNAIRLRRGTESTITKNQILKNTMEGISLETCLRITILDNNFQNSGIVISGPITAWDTHNIENNTANDKNIYYYKNENGITIPEDAIQLILVNCSNIEIKNLNFEKVIIGIQICYSSYITIENNYFQYNMKNTIQLYYSDNNTIYNNNINNGNGIDLIDANNNNIQRNTIENTETAINIDNSDDNNINENTIFNNINGIFLINGNKNNIYQNDIFSNTEYGFFIQTNSNNNIISENKIYNNEIGIRLKGSEFNNIITNEFKNNSDKGLYICCGANDNNVYKNSFIKNLRHIDYSTSYENYLYKDGLGNYWDDYQTRYPSAKQINGVWDTPYKIPDSKYEDLYPLVEKIKI